MTPAQRMSKRLYSKLSTRKDASSSVVSRLFQLLPAQTGTHAVNPILCISNTHEYMRGSAREGLWLPRTAFGDCRSLNESALRPFRALCKPPDWCNPRGIDIHRRIETACPDHIPPDAVRSERASAELPKAILLLIFSGAAAPGIPAPAGKPSCRIRPLSNLPQSQCAYRRAYMP